MPDPAGTRPPLPSPVAPLAPGGPVAPGPTDDWPKQATDSIVRAVDSVRDKTAGPALTAARFLVYGTVLLLLSIPLFVLLLVFCMRGMEHLLIGIYDRTGLEVFAEPMWIVYTIFGLAFLSLGSWCWRRSGKPPTAAAQPSTP